MAAPGRKDGFRKEWFKTMEQHLIVDSCCELTDELQHLPYLSAVPLTIAVESQQFVDDETLKIPELLTAMKHSRQCPKSACPAPEQYAERMRGAVWSFVVTLSSKLSGSYNSAINARDTLREENPEKRVHVFDSCSASAGELAIALKLRECIEEKLDFDSTVERVEQFIREMKTFFILENLDTLIKAGRMSRITGYVASTMSLRPIMTADHGEIKLFEKARGSVRAFTRLVDIIGEKCTSFADRTLVITHCNNEHQARFIKAEAQKRYDFQSIVVAPTRGISTMYANEGGVVIAF